MNFFFSIIIPTRNRHRQLARCLKSLFALDYPTNHYEVLVVDDGSEVSPREIVAHFENDLPVRLLCQGKAGPAAARNAGVLQARGAYLAFTDDDCLPSKGWLKALAGRFTKKPDCAIVGRVINAVRDNIYSEASQLLVDYLHEYYSNVQDRLPFATSNNLALSAERFNSVGGFNIAFTRAGGEDRDLADNLVHNGCPIIYAPEVHVQHTHCLSALSFLRQHFNYGRGAHLFHLIRSQRQDQGIRLEPLPFYLDLLHYPWDGSVGDRQACLTGLLFISQLANGAGFFWQMSSGGWKPADHLNKF